jgi:coenzyme Q-binding protein COQ10
MNHYSERLIVPFSTTQMFDLASDVESYPLFLDGWRAVRVVREEDGVRLVKQVLGMGPLKWTFHSRAAAARPDWLEIASDEAPFRRLQIDWRFRELPGAGSEVDFSAVTELRSRTASKLASDVLTHGFDRTVAAFERRAHALYGPVRAPHGDLDGR